MTFSDSIRTCMQEKFFDFQGRASRSEFWWFYLFLIIVNVVWGFIVGLIVPVGMTQVLVSYLPFLALLLPYMGVSIRRFHDRNIPTWVFLVLFAVLMIPNLYLQTVIGGNPEAALQMMGENAALLSIVSIISGIAAIAMLIICVLKGTAGPNRFGPDPLGASSTDVFE